MKGKRKGRFADLAENFFTTKKDIRQFKKWIKALRSGKYKQIEGSLQYGDGFCCLGVGCKILVPRKALTLDPDGTILHGLPEDQIWSPKWLKEINEDFGVRGMKADTEGIEYESPLIDLNDSMKLSFDEIADCLEAVYLHGAWDMPPQKKGKLNNGSRCSRTSNFRKWERGSRDKRRHW